MQRLPILYLLNVCLCVCVFVSVSVWMSERPFFVRSARCAINFLPCLLYNFICWHFLLFSEPHTFRFHSHGLCLDLIFVLFSIWDLPLGFGVCVCAFVSMCVCVCANRKIESVIEEHAVAAEDFVLFHFWYQNIFVAHPGAYNSTFPISDFPFAYRLYGSKLASLPDSQFESESVFKSPSAFLSVCVCSSISVHFYCFISNCGRCSSIFVYVTNLILNYIYFFSSSETTGPNSICFRVAKKKKWIEIEFEKCLKKKIAGLWLPLNLATIYAVAMQICHSHRATPNFHSNAKSKQDNLLC